MGWERRKNHWYYTRSRRVDGKVVRTYFGRGPKAEAAAAEDELRRQKLREEREQDAIELDNVAAIAAATDQFHQFVDMILKAEMVIRGYHYHRGQWRRRRGYKELLAGAEALRREREQKAAQEKAALARAQRLRRPIPIRSERRDGPGMLRGSFVSQSRVIKAIHPSPPRQLGRTKAAFLSPLLARRAKVRCTTERRSRGRRHTNRRGKQGTEPRPPP